MEKREIMGVKMEDGIGSSSSLGYLFRSTFDSSEVEKSSLGFMELLGVQDYSPLLELPQVSTMSVPHNSALAIGKQFSEVLKHQPATPNSSSISSSSSEAANDEQNKTVDQAPEKQKTPKQLKPKKTNQKRQREPRFAFMTKSKVDHLEDGYKWRKYGQKAVKNSPFPRSYYRCTNASCNVKKRVERSFKDPGIVVTTYEGQHTHPSPLSGFGSVMPGNYLSQYYQHQHHHQHQHQQLFVNALSSLGFPSSSLKNEAFPQETNAFLRDHGLLEDVIPIHKC